MTRKLPERRKRAARREGVHLRVHVAGMPELDTAIAAGQVRGLLCIALSPVRRGLPGEGARGGLGADPIELAADEEIVARVPVRFPDAGNEAEAVLIAKRAALPRLKIGADDPRLAELARALARGAVQS